MRQLSLTMLRKQDSWSVASPENDPKDLLRQAVPSRWPVWASCPL